MLKDPGLSPDSRRMLALEVGLTWNCMRCYDNVPKGFFIKGFFR